MDIFDRAILILLEERLRLFEIGKMTYDKTEEELVKKVQDKIDYAIELLKKKK